MNLLSVEVADLVKLMDSAEGPLQVEDQTYISNALTHCKLGKQFKLVG